jgi:hypothetical protein
MWPFSFQFTSQLTINVTITLLLNAYSAPIYIIYKFEIKNNKQCGVKFWKG